LDSELTPQPGPESRPFGEPVSSPPSPDPSQAPAYHDRGTGLVIFGVVQIILGCFAALLIPMIALGAFMSRLAPGASMRPGALISGMGTYALLAAALITLGIGSIQMKRWARALTLVISWYWLVMGVLITILMTALLPVATKNALAQAQQNAQAGPSPALSTGVMAVILTVVIIIGAFFLVIVPIALVIFYGRKDVEETVRHRDAKERWTDRTPLPVLGASVALFTGSVYMLMVGLTTPLFPFFGHYLTGIAGTLCFMLWAAVDFYLSVALFRRQSSGWWIAALIVPLRLFSMILTYGRADLMQAYAKVGMSSEELRMLNANPMFRSHVILWWSLLSLVLFYGYLLWLKRYFKAPAPAALDSQVAQLS